MAIRWQCRVDGNLELVATSYDGTLAASTQYNSENAADLAGMMARFYDLDGLKLLRFRHEHPLPPLEIIEEEVT